MSRHDLELAIEWAATEGWNPGLHDADCFYAADPQGFFMGFLGDEPIGSISAVKYGTTFGFIGLYIVRPPFRGCGYGLQLWQTALVYLQGRTIGLDGVVAQQANYLKSGFKLAYRNIRYEGISKGAQGSDRGHPDITDISFDCVPLASLPIEQVLQYDRPFFPDDRTRFLKTWLAQSASSGTGCLVDQRLKGYGLIRRCRQGFKVGPLLADTPQIAEAIFLALTNQIETDHPFYLDVPTVNSAAVALARRYNLRSIFETARMYTNSAPALPMDKLFGVTTFELG